MFYIQISICPNGRELMKVEVFSKLYRLPTEKLDFASLALFPIRKFIGNNTGH